MKKVSRLLFFTVLCLLLALSAFCLVSCEKDPPAQTTPVKNGIVFWVLSEENHSLSTAVIDALPGVIFTGNNETGELLMNDTVLIDGILIQAQGFFFDDITKDGKPDLFLETVTNDEDARHEIYRIDTASGEKTRIVSDANFDYWLGSFEQKLRVVECPHGDRTPSRSGTLVYDAEGRVSVVWDKKIDTTFDTIF